MARIAGISHGFLLFDDTGSEWTRQGEKFTSQHMPNRFVYSRDQNAASAPYFTVTLGPEDHSRRRAPTALRWDTEGLPTGEATVSWLTPRDEGGAGTIGFFVRVNGRDAPRTAIPRAGNPGDRVFMRLRDLQLKDGR